MNEIILTNDIFNITITYLCIISAINHQTTTQNINGVHRDGQVKKMITVKNNSGHFINQKYGLREKYRNSRLAPISYTYNKYGY